MGALECKLPNGKRFDVGSGFNMDQRRKPPKKGSVITFKFQELSNAGIPRFPVFLRVRTDLTWEDVLESAKTKTPVSLKQKVVPSTKLSKKHSILFSVIPSRDEKTGKKVVTPDDVGEQASSSSSSSLAPTSEKEDEREMCPYGEKCYRKNPDHLKQYQHPSRQVKPKLEKTTSRSKSSNQSKRKIESEESISPTTTDSLLVNDKNKGRKFDGDDDDDDIDQDDDNANQQSSTTKNTNKRKRNVEKKSSIKPTRKRVKKS